ncbi:hypothetical protein E0H56_03715 [Rhizobium leguminosarum bv. viciae]|uniref:hypothetical protein n=1 Tax=Rhizobium leguminosarum TaxID=384 RepID=UPI00103918EA|nr:hypothetical protein [Rhizobium leguminosarum]TBZ98225.1 hypothetical protein E0H56_03715 [Rhizobium leguminosarum bv. viciae]
MKITAWAHSKNTWHTHKIVETPVLEHEIEIESDGNVCVKLTSEKISLSGQYALRLKLTPDEVRLIYSELMTGDLKKRIEALELRLGEE